MRVRQSGGARRHTIVAVTVALAAWYAPADAQDRLRQMPGYERSQQVRAETQGLASAFAAGAVTWKDDRRAFDFVRDGKRYRFDLATRKSVAAGDAPHGSGGGRGRGSHEAGSHGTSP